MKFIIRIKVLEVLIEFDTIDQQMVLYALT